MGELLGAIDHITVAGRDLGELRERLAGAGLATAYGGAHSNGITHMAVTPMADGSYLEAISTLEPGATDAPLWGPQIVADAGACAWAVRCDDVQAELARLDALGIPVRGPEPLDRHRPDGVHLRWLLGFAGEGPPGSMLPFLIEDLTRRELRIEAPETDWVRPTGPALAVAGVETVVLAVQDAGLILEQLGLAYGLREAAPRPWPELDAEVRELPGSPVAVATPASRNGWLAGRLERFGPAPCAFVLGATGAGERRWLAPERLGDLRLGVTSADRGRP
ncbi:MAG: VOC family protein [Acidobacteriota bacterium]|nr:VOC family protein [Acidobacteriota bacterium]